MDRRHFLRAVPLGLVTSSIGCIGLTPGESTSNGAENDDTLTTSTTDGSDPTPDPDDPVQIVFVDDAERTVTIRLARSDQTILNVTETISSDYRAFDSGITSTGTYELSVTFQDGPESTGDLHIEPYDVRMGSNVIIRMRDGQIVFSMEE
jgi:hypothetical protein